MFDMDSHALASFEACLLEPFAREPDPRQQSGWVVSAARFALGKKPLNKNRSVTGGRALRLASAKASMRTTRPG